VTRDRSPLFPAITNPASQVRSAWQRQADRVPPEWADPAYVIDTAPYRELFTQNANYQPGRAFDFGPTGHDRMRAETAWWLWTCWREGLRKVEPSMLRWWSDSLAALAAARAPFAGGTPASVADFEPALVVREALRAFTERNGRTPSPGNLRNLTSIAEHAHAYISVRGSDQPWWAHDTWDLRIDDRIPRRPHEPAAHKPVRLAPIEPVWLREGIRFWLRTALTGQLYRWTTITTRAATLGTYFSPWVAAHGDTHPALTDTSGDLREAFTDYLSWLRSPAATTRGTPLAEEQVGAIQDHVQAFYRFMLDHADQAIAATGDPRWADLTEAHARLWVTTRRRRRRSHAPRLDDWISAADMARMVACLPILSAPTTETVTITLPGGHDITSPGIGDPQAARAWLLQAMTGRRVSEILMIDFDPLTAIPGVDPDTVAEDDYIARLTYQQTKVDGVDNTILVDGAAVHLIHEQQEYALSRVEAGATPTYLFLDLRHNHKGLRPRSYPSHGKALSRLDQVVSLRDGVDKPLRFTSTHRLRHTKATEMIEAGVPIHVVQRYFGHASPEMLMRYAATLASRAEHEFLKAKRAGAFGTPLTMNATDLYEITTLSGRTDRILPNGLCLLPPVSVCEKGNACLTCGHFATDSRHLSDLHEQRRSTLELIEIRQGAFAQRHGAPMPDNHVWLQQRHRELASLDAITTALNAADTVTGAGTPARTTTEEP